MSQLFTLGWNDVGKGLLMAIIGAVLTIIYSQITSVNGIDWGTVGQVAITAGVGYLIKNFFSGTGGLLSNTPTTTP